MGEKFVNIDRQTPLLLPPDLREWVPADHLVHFLIEVLEGMSMEQAKVNRRGTGNEQYPPRMMLGLLVYGYVSGRFSSREIERATYVDVAMRYLAGDCHPDHDTLCKFRRENGALLKEAFTAVLLLAKEMGFLRVGSVSLDGTKVLANASKHKAASFARAGEQIEFLEGEVEELLKRAEEADQQPKEDGLSIPEEITRRKERMAKLTEARRVIAGRVKEKAAREQQQYEEKLAERERRKAQGKRTGGRPPQPPSDTPSGREQYNFTDPQSRIMKVGNGKRFEQCYNAQAAVDADGGSLLIVGARVSDQANDKEQLCATAAAIPVQVGTPEAILADSGFYSEKQVAALEERQPTLVYAAVGKQSHRRTLADLAPHQEPEALAESASAKEKMAHRLRTASGKALYKLRKQTVEPVFGIIKEVMGFRRFSLRGLEKVSLEWDLVSLAYNLKRLFTLQAQKAA